MVVGHGQLGSAIAAAVTARTHAEGRSYPTDWSTPAAAARSIGQGLQQEGGFDGPVVVVWAAGRCGMSSGVEECQESLAVSAAALGVLAELRPHATHLLGSAGAVALGHPRWSPSDGSLPDLPYGRLKLQEEELVGRLDLGDLVVHRVSSVYGPPDRPGRQGMITALVVNASRLRATRIYGRWSTLRNYVHADDVGAFIADKAVRHTGPAVHVLAAHRSHAISELVGAVATARRRSVPVQLVPSENADDLTIDPNAIDPGFRTRPLDTAIRQMVLDLRHVSVA